MDEYHDGWMLTPPDQEGFALPSPPMSEEEEAFCKKMVGLASKAHKKIRRRVEDRLRKGGFWAVIKAAHTLDQSPGLLEESDLRDL